uniref:Uncharacterized protein n=1 Tax=Ascaris lumbricoides TaxID=6252 RepID=A0A0M3HUV7_ASCLU
MFLRRFWKERDRERRREEAARHRSSAANLGSAHPCAPSIGAATRKVTVPGDLTTTTTNDDKQLAGNITARCDS